MESHWKRRRRQGAKRHLKKKRGVTGGVSSPPGFFINALSPLFKLSVFGKQSFLFFQAVGIKKKIRSAQADAKILCANSHAYPASMHAGFWWFKSWWLYYELDLFTEALHLAPQECHYSVRVPGSQ
ncbi:hypothetical protein MRB53_004187 [Persea americana]|uniref:Uncharacterized protein n=1 Tax=Persea americana TaxID=3435 RepID=A0ACC2N1G7_PERAE|nr:hypothetical protein MRB53_004187 [Persea americana]